MTQNLPRLYAAPPLLISGLFDLEKSQAHYLVHVLRLAVNSRFLIFDGKAGEWLAEVAEVKKSRCTVRCLEQVRSQTTPQDLHYLFAPLKHARIDYMVQKAVEMGASCLQPTLTAHTQPARMNIERMRANTIEAAEQCGVLSIPEIREPVKLETVLKNWDASRMLIFCDERAANTSAILALSEANQSKIAVLIGPEGGFSNAERQTLLSKAFVIPISLGPRIMRADTAAVAALALVNAVLGDWR